MANDEDVQKTGSAKGSRRNIVMISLIILVMGLEGGGIFLAMKIFGSAPQEVDAAAMMGEGMTGWNDAGFVEMVIADLEAPHIKTGKAFIYDIRIAVRIRPEGKEAVEKLLASHKEMLMDRLNRIIRAAEPAQLEEDGLEVIRRQMKYELDQALGDETIIEEVLLPRFIKMRADL